MHQSQSRSIPPGVTAPQIYAEPLLNMDRAPGIDAEIECPKRFT